MCLNTIQGIAVITMELIKNILMDLQFFKTRWIFLVLIFISFLYLLVSNYVNTKLKSKICAIGSFIGITFLLFAQNITYTVTYIASLKSEWWIAIIDNSITIIIFLISDIIIAYFFILRKSFGRKNIMVS